MFVAELSARAATEKTSINSLILRAVRQDLDNGRETKKSRRRRKKILVEKRGSHRNSSGQMN
jgi:hypothetical protein